MFFMETNVPRSGVQLAEAENVWRHKGARRLTASRYRTAESEGTADGSFWPADTLRAEFDTAMAGRAPSKVVHM